MPWYNIPPSKPLKTSKNRSKTLNMENNNIENIGKKKNKHAKGLRRPSFEAQLGLKMAPSTGTWQIQLHSMATAQKESFLRAFFLVVVFVLFVLFVFIFCLCLGLLYFIVIFCLVCSNCFRCGVWLVSLLLLVCIGEEDMKELGKSPEL